MLSRATVLPFLLFWSLFWSLGGSQGDGRTATFYGSHYHMGLQPAPSELTVDLRFRSSQPTGLLFVARLHTGYFALGVRERQLCAVLNHNEQIHQFHFGTVDSSDWKDVGVHLQNTLMNATFNSDVLTFVLNISSVISFTNISFGGPDFFVDLDLNTTKYFVGCLTNVSVNNREVVFTPDQGRYGIETGCCPDIRPASWCFSSPTSYLNLNASTTSSNQLVVSFRIQSYRDGVVLFSRTESDTIVLKLYLGSLHLEVGSNYLDCPGQITNDNWHSVWITVRPAALQCEVNGRENLTVVSLLSLSLTSPFYIGSPMMSSVTAFSSQDVSDTFGGCIQEFQVNSIEVVPITIDTNGPQISGGCDEVPTSPTQPSESPTLECAVLGQSNLIDWEQLEIVTESIMVTEGGEALITLNSLRVQFSFTELSQSIIDIIETSIRFYVTSEPTDGYFQRTDSNAQISSFSYEDLEARLIMYRHSGAEDRLDYVILKVTVECDSEVLLERPLPPLYFNVTLENDSPEILQQSAMNIAIGTRQVISQEVITVTDAETSRALDITYTVQSVDTCGQCSEEERAGQIERTDTPGQAHIFFTQDDVDRGEISFQHFARFGNATVKIYLLVTDLASGQISVEITVNPYEGHINLTANRCLYVVEGAPAVIQPRHLLATTDFQDQSPTLTYDILSSPSHGTLERLEEFDPHDESTWQWEPIDEVVKNKDSFTQAYINASRVRYVHNNSILPVVERDSFEAHLRSTNLTGPELSFCIHVIYNETFQQSNIDIEVGDIHVVEGGEAELILNATFSPSIFADWMEQEIAIGQLAVTYVISPRPLYGEIQVRGEPHDTFTHTDLQSGAVMYRHNGTEDHLDSFSLYAELQSPLTLPTWVLERTPAENISVTVQPVNNHKPQIVQREPISPPEGGWVTLTPAMLEVLDEDQPGDSITIHIRRITKMPNGYFAFRDSSHTRIRQLTMEDIRQGRVIFVHILNSSVPLSYRQAIKANDQDPSHTVKDSILVEAIPLNLTAAPVNLPNTSCIGEIDATLSPRSLPLDYSTISLSLEDHHGNDSNRLQDVRIVVVAPPRYGVVRRKGEGTASHSFTAAELSNQTLEYHFRDQGQLTETDSFELEFRYGHTSSGPIPFHVCIDPVPIPSVVYSKNISAARGGVADLDASVLLATDTRGGLNHSLLYTVTIPPRYGILCDEFEGCPEALTSFSQHAVNIGRIIYNHTDTSNTELRDSFSFIVCTSYLNCTRRHSVTVSLFVSSLIIVNTGFQVLEGGNHSIQISELNAIAPQGYNVIFVINKQPQRGNLSFQIHSRSRSVPPATHFDSQDLISGFVVYYHDKSETLSDCFEFTATAVPQNQDTVAPNGTIPDHTGMVHVTILPVNNKTPRLYNFTETIVAVQGGTLAITRDLMSAHDSDSDAVDDLLTYRVFFNGPVGGFLYFGDDPNRRRILSWTEGDIRSGRLFYQHTSTRIFRDLVAFTLSDGRNEVGYIFQIELRTVLFKRNSTYSRLTVVEGGSDVITQEYLHYVSTNDPNLNDEDYVYQIQRWPSHGQLFFDGSNATQFSQEDLLRGTLVYSHDHSNDVSDSFGFIITVPSRQNAMSDPYTFEIDITGVDDEAPVVQYIREPMFVVELTQLTIRHPQDITIIDIDSDTAIEQTQVICTITELPRHGYIRKKNFNLRYFIASEFSLHDLYEGNVAYFHEEAGQWSDHFSFRVTDGIPNPQPEISRVNITILPQVVSVNVTNIAVREGGEVALAPANFHVEHPYLRHVPGEIHVTFQPEHGLLLNTHTNGSNLSSFTTEDLARGAILYRHDGDESEQDRFVFEYKNQEPSGFQRKSNRKRLNISISLVNDQPPILDSGRERIMRLWVGQKVVLNRTYLNATDGDTPPQNLIYNFSISSDVGHIVNSSAPHQELNFFTQNDVNTGQVLLVHGTSIEGIMAYRVSDEISFTEGSFVIIAEQLVLRCYANQSTNVSMGGSVAITPVHLLYGTSDRLQREIRYTVLTPMHGKIVVDSIESNQFTQLDVNASRVQYVHTDFDRWEPKDTLVITASADLAEDDTFQFTVFIAYPKSPYSELAVNEPVVIQEGQRKCFDESVLDARNLRYSTWQMHQGNLLAYAIIFQPTAPPLHGSYIINDMVKNTSSLNYFTQDQLADGIVCYQHDDTETVFDTLPFKLMIRDNGTLRSTYYSSINITIEPVNDEDPVLETTSLNMTAVMGYNATISRLLLRVTDRDTLAKDIWYTVLTQPQNGKLYNDRVVITVGQSFTQDDIDAGLLKFEPLYSVEGVFNFTFSDRLSTSERPVHSFTVYVENHAVVLEHKETITYRQDRPDQVVSSNFLNTSTNGFRNETRFVIRQTPSNGNLGLTTGEFFTQTQVDENMIRYVPTNLTSHRDKFVVDIMNRNFVIPNVTIEVRVLALGHVMEDVHLNLSSGTEPALPLPAGLLQLDSLQNAIHRPPTIRVIRAPTYGHLELRYTSTRKRSSHNEEAFSFRYDELQFGWIYYVLDPNYLDTSLLEETFDVVVFSDGRWQPGELTVELTIQPPPFSPATSSSSPSVSSPVPTTPSLQGSDSSSGFSMYALVPILGTFIILIIVIAVVIVFCISQQKNIRKRWKAKPSAPTQHPYPWSVQPPSALPRPSIPGRYDSDPVEDNSENGEDVRLGLDSPLGYTESPLSRPIHSQSRSSPPRYSPVYSQRYTPVYSQARSSPPHGHPRPRAHRVQSIVSISLSNRRSSNASLTEYSYRPTPSPYPVVTPIPIRPLSHAPSRKNSKDEGEGPSSAEATKESTAARPTSSEGCESGMGSRSVSDCTSSRQSPVPGASPSADSGLNFGGPEMMQLFRSSNPVLKKQEYWV